MTTPLQFVNSVTTNVKHVVALKSVPLVNPPLDNSIRPHNNVLVSMDSLTTAMTQYAKIVILFVRNVQVLRVVMAAHC